MALNWAADAFTTGRASAHPVMTTKTVTSSRPSRRLFPSFQAAGLPSFSRSRAQVGTKAQLIQPCANRMRNHFVDRNATTHASIAVPAPKDPARTCSLTSPSTRLVNVATPVVPAERNRRLLGWARGGDGTGGSATVGML